MKLIKADTYTLSALKSSAFSVMCKGLAFVLQLLIAYHFGANVGTDIYFYLFNLAVLTAGMVQTVCTSILVPRAMELRSRNRCTDEMSLHNSFLYTVLLLLLASMVVFNLVAGHDAPSLLMNFRPEDTARHLTLYYLFFPFTLLLTLNLYLGEILISFKYFTLGLLCNFSMNLACVVAILLTGPGKGDVALLMYAACTGCLLNAAVFLGLLKRRLHWQFKPVNLALLRREWKAIGGLLFNQFITLLSNALPLYFMSQLHPGLVTVVVYAQKFTQMPLSIITQIAAVLQVKLNNLYHRHLRTQMYATTFRVALRLLAFAVCTSAAIFLLRDFIAETLYGLGKMPLDAVDRLSHLIGILSFAMPATAVCMAYTRVYFTERRIRLYVGIMSCANLLACVAYYIAIGLWQENGFAAVSVGTEVLILLAVLICLRRNKGNTRLYPSASFSSSKEQQP